MTTLLTMKGFNKQGWAPSTIAGSTTIGDFTPSAQGSDIQGCYISPDGAKMYISFWSNKTLYQYSLSTPRDVSTASPVRYISVTKPAGLYFSNDGRYMFIGDESSGILRYTLSTPRDISTASYSQTLNIGGAMINISFSEDGQHLYYQFWGNQFIFNSYDLSTAWDLSTASNNKTRTTSLGGIVVKNNGQYLYVYDNTTQATYQYSLSTPYDITSTKTLIGSYDSVLGDPRAFFVDNECKYWCLALGGGGGAGTYIRQFQTVQI